MIAIVTDSSCDIPQEHRQGPDLTIVPALLTVGDETLRDGVDITREAFYNLLPGLAAIPTTSAPSPAAFVEAYEGALRRADHVVAVITASELSGLFNAARLAAEEVSPARIHLIDSGQTSMGLGWGALAGLEAARRGEPLQGVIHSVRDTLRRVRVYALLNTVEYLARSGRVSLVQMGLSNLLSIKPIIELRHGVVTSLARVRTWSRAVDALARYTRALVPLERLAIMHSNCMECASDLVGRIEAILPPGEVITTSATTVIGTHVGPGAVGIAAVIGRADR